MPEPAFMKLYNAALVRDCAAVQQFFRQGGEFGAGDWAQRVKYADTLVALGNEFTDGVNSVARERGLIDDDTATPICPRCGLESCPGASAAMMRVVKVMQTQPES